MSQHDEERASERAAALVKGLGDGNSLTERLRARARNTTIPHSIFDEAVDEIERLRRINACFLGALNEIAGGITPPDQNGHYLAHREAVRLARKAVRFAS